MDKLLLLLLLLLVTAMALPTVVVLAPSKPATTTTTVAATTPPEQRGYFGYVAGTALLASEEVREAIDALARVSAEPWGKEALMMLASRLPTPVIAVPTAVPIPYIESLPLVRTPTATVTPTVTTAVSTLVAGKAAVEVGAPSYSPTNVIVAGVDEPDPVKTNGTHVFVASRDLVYVVKAFPVETMSVEKVINVTADINALARPAELRVVVGNTTVHSEKLYLRTTVVGLYVRGGTLVVLAETWVPWSVRELLMKTSLSSVPPYYSAPRTTWVLVYDSSGKVRDYAWVTGDLVDSRLSWPKLVLVASQPAKPLIKLGVPRIIEAPQAHTSWGPVPVNATAYVDVPPAWTTTVVLLNLETGRRCAASIVGPRASYIYMTPYGEVYVLASSYAYVIPLVTKAVEVLVQSKPGSPEDVKKILSVLPPPPKLPYGMTLVVHVSTKNDTVAVVAAERYEGRAVSQFAVDAKDGYVRLVLQRGWMRGFNVYVLDAETLKLVGKLEGIADGERVHGIRFVGDKLYVVTYRAVDPLFVVDLSDPKNPRILGYRKGPGFDEYLHPWNETALIGLGFTDDRKLRASTYVVHEDGSIELVSRVVINGTKSSWTPVFAGRWGHHAFLLDREHNIIAFPGLGYVVKKITKTVGAGEEAKIMWVGGVHVLTIDPTTLKLGYKDYLEHRDAFRVLYIDDTLYSISRGSVKAFSLPELEPVKTLELKP